MLKHKLALLTSIEYEKSRWLNREDSRKEYRAIKSNNKKSGSNRKAAKAAAKSRSRNRK